MPVMPHRFKLAVTHPGIAPVKHFDMHEAHIPPKHFPLGRLVEVDSIAARQRPPVIIHLASLAGLPDTEDRPGWPARPIGGGTVDFFVIAQGCSQRRVVPIAEMSPLIMRVGRGANRLEPGMRQWLFIRRQRAHAS